MSNFLKDLRSVMILPVWVAGLGYFVDMFDLTLFGVVRVQSLVAMGYEAGSPELLAAGVKLYNLQMIGMMVGGLFWGILGDKKGRLSVLFGSILIYSLGNLANAFVSTFELYAVCRFLTGLGLAGELGAAVTLVAEQLPKEKRGLGTTFVATLGLSGAVAASLFGMYLDWRAAYILGGCMGLALLFTRFKMSDSSIFHKAETSGIKRGNISLLFKPSRLKIYVACILIGAPIYLATGILMTFSPELTQGLGIEGVIAPLALLYGTIGLTIGDMASGLLSQFLRARKLALYICLLGAAVFTSVYLFTPGLGAQGVYWICFGIGIFLGYWAVLVTVAAEQFGTNIRATVATSVPNFVRGTAVIATTAFLALKGSMGAQQAAVTVAVTIFLLAFASVSLLKETFGQDLDFVET
jgi:putative MFS transporter